MGGMMPWNTRNKIRNSVAELPDEIKTSTKMVPENMRDSMLLHQLCGEDCRKCDVMCNFGAEALRRGLDVMQKRERLKRGKRKMLPQVLERPEGYFTIDEMAERWGVHNASVEHWFYAARVQPECRYYAGAHKMLSLYREKRVMEQILAYNSDGRHEVTRTRIMKVKEVTE